MVENEHLAIVNTILLVQFNRRAIKGGAEFTQKQSLNAALSSRIRAIHTQTVT